VMAKRHIPGVALAVIRQGRVERVASYGVASLEFSVPVTPTTLFHVASVTKSFTAAAIMKLVEAGNLKLDDPIGTYLEGLPQSWRMVKVRQLLGHTYTRALYVVADVASVTKSTYVRRGRPRMACKRSTASASPLMPNF
jgi:hypothetical protein